MKEHHQIALHVACGDITDVELQDGKLVVNIEDGMILNLLTEGRRDIESALRWQGLDLSLKINIKTQELSRQEEDLKKLKAAFGDNVTIRR